MSKITVVDNEFQTAWCHPTKRLMEHKWHKYCAGEPLREIMNTTAAAFEKYKCIKWLFDDRNFGAMHPDDIAWGTTFWGPRMFEAGWKYHAIVLPDRIIGQMGLTAMINWYEENGVQVKAFPSLDEARQWLESKGTLGINFSSQ